MSQSQSQSHKEEWIRTIQIEGRDYWLEVRRYPNVTRRKKCDWYLHENGPHYVHEAHGETVTVEAAWKAIILAAWEHWQKNYLAE